MKTKFGIVGCGFLGNIVADAWKNGLLPDYELVGVTSRTRASAEKTAETVGCAVCDDVDALLALEPEYIVETASVGGGGPRGGGAVEKRGSRASFPFVGWGRPPFGGGGRARGGGGGGGKGRLARGPGGFDVLQTVTLMAQAQQLAETAGIETHTGARGFRNTPVWEEHLLTDTEKDHCVHRQCQAGHCHLPAPGQRSRGHLSGHHRPGDHRRDHAFRPPAGWVTITASLPRSRV